MTKRTIEIDLEIVAEKVAEVIAKRLTLGYKEKEIAKESNLKSLQFLTDDDFQNELIIRYLDKTESLFKDVGHLIEIFGVNFEDE